MTKLTKREIILLNILFLIGIVGLGMVMWIMPMYQGNKTLKETNETLKKEQANISYIIGNADKIEANTNDLQAKVVEAMKSFDASFSNLTVSDIADASNLTIVSIERTKPIVRKVLLEAANQEKLEYEINTLVESLKHHPEAKSENLESNFEIAYQEVTVTYTGGLDATKSFVKNFNAQIKTGYINLLQRNDDKNEGMFVIGIYSIQPLESNY